MNDNQSSMLDDLNALESDVSALPAEVAIPASVEFADGPAFRPADMRLFGANEFSVIISVLLSQLGQNPVTITDADVRALDPIDPNFSSVLACEVSESGDVRLTMHTVPKSEFRP